MQLKDSKSFVSKGSLLAVDDRGVGWANAKAVETDGPIGKYLADEYDGAAAEIVNYLIFSEISEECDLMNPLGSRASPIRSLSNSVLIDVQSL